MKISLTKKTAWLVLGFLIAAQPVFAQTDDGNKSLSTDEYNDLPKGLLLSGKDGDKTKTDEAAATDPQNSESGRMSYETALKLYRQGKFNEALQGLIPMAQQGQSSAQELLGIMYRMGQGVPKNPELAFENMRKAAEDNKALAQHHLGVMYFTGEGVKADAIQALAWLHIAIVHYPDGPEKTRAEQDRDNVYKALNRRDKESALKVAHDFLEKKGEAHLLDMQ